MDEVHVKIKELVEAVKDAEIKHLKEINTAQKG